jgi:DNA-binding Lrp family transcriptional regulator
MLKGLIGDDWMQSGISVFIGAVTDEKVKTSVIIERLKKIGGIHDIYELTGSLDILIFATNDSLHEINKLVEDVRACEGVRTATTYIVLEKTTKQ